MIYVKNQGQWKAVKLRQGSLDKFQVGVKDLTERWMKANQVWVKSNGIWKKTLPATLTNLNWQTVVNVNNIPRDAYQILSQWEIIFYQSVTLNNMPRGTYIAELVGGGGKGSDGYYGWTANPPRLNYAEYMWAGGGASGGPAEYARNYLSAPSRFGNKFVLHVGGAGQQTNIYVNDTLVITASAGRDGAGMLGGYQGDSYWVSLKQGVKTTSVRASGGEPYTFYPWGTGNRGSGGRGGDAWAYSDRSGCHGGAQGGSYGTGGAVLLSSDWEFWVADRYKTGF